MENHFFLFKYVLFVGFFFQSNLFNTNEKRNVVNSSDITWNTKKKKKEKNNSHRYLFH